MNLQNNKLVRVKQSYLVSVFSITHKQLEAGNMKPRNVAHNQMSTLNIIFALLDHLIRSLVWRRQLSRKRIIRISLMKYKITRLKTVLRLLWCIFGSLLDKLLLVLKGNRSNMLKIFV